MRVFHVLEVHLAAKQDKQAELHILVVQDIIVFKELNFQIKIHVLPELLLIALL